MQDCSYPLQHLHLNHYQPAGLNLSLKNIKIYNRPYTKFTMSPLNCTLEKHTRARVH